MLTEILCFKKKLYWNIKIHNSDICFIYIYIYIYIYTALCIYGVIKSLRMESKELVLSISEESCTQGFSEES